MTESVVFKKGVCQCRKCNEVFHQNDIKRIHNDLRIDLLCPNCGSNNFGLMDYSIDEFELIYKKKNYWSRINPNSKYITNNMVSYNRK